MPFLRLHALVTTISVVCTLFGPGQPVSPPLRLPAMPQLMRHRDATLTVLTLRLHEDQKQAHREDKQAPDVEGIVKLCMLCCLASPTLRAHVEGESNMHTESQRARLPAISLAHLGCQLLHAFLQQGQTDLKPKQASKTSEPYPRCHKCLSNVQYSRVCCAADWSEAYGACTSGSRWLKAALHVALRFACRRLPALRRAAPGLALCPHAAQPAHRGVRTSLRRPAVQCVPLRVANYSSRSMARTQARLL